MKYCIKCKKTTNSGICVCGGETKEFDESLELEVRGLKKILSSMYSNCFGCKDGSINTCKKKASYGRASVELTNRSEILIQD